jgi:hypothetical protein
MRSVQLIGSSVPEAVKMGPERVKLKNALLKAVTWERLVKTEQAGKRLSGCCGDFWTLAIAL